LSSVLEGEADGDFQSIIFGDPTKITSTDEIEDANLNGIQVLSTTN
jgi:hypothetical protein